MLGRFTTHLFAMELHLLLLLCLHPCVSKFLIPNIVKKLPCKTINTELVWFRLEVPEFSKYHVQNIYQCLNLALKMDDVLSVNYNAVSMMCYLNREWGSKDFKPDKEFVFVEIPDGCVKRLDHAIESHNNWKQTCKYQECSSQETCLSVNSNKQTVCTNFAVDGVWGTWSAYTDCPVACGGGQKSRTRVCDNPAPAYGGLPCPGKASEDKRCNTHACPVDGVWGRWSDYTDCDVACGGGQSTRTRVCDDPAPAYGGLQCLGKASESQSCNEHACPVDGGWGAWSSYSSCTLFCAGLTKTRTRQCNNPAPTAGGANCPNHSTDNIDSEACGTLPCYLTFGK